MIQINKSADIPGILTNKGAEATAANCAAYEAGSRTFTILGGIYGHLSVKRQLVADQHTKCCFCEADFTANGFGDVEHFRPKGGYVKNLTGGPLLRPGYYWLAYDWENLLFSCEVCNRRQKQNYFPIADELQRAESHLQNYRLEQPLLIHPVLDDPEQHIRFNQHVPVAIDDRGQASIDGYGLNRENLNRVRERYFKQVNEAVVLARFDLDVIDDSLKSALSNQMKTPWRDLEQTILAAKEFVKIAPHDTSPFSAMVRANFPNLV